MRVCVSNYLFQNLVNTFDEGFVEFAFIIVRIRRPSWNVIKLILFKYFMANRFDFILELPMLVWLAQAITPSLRMVCNEAG